MENFISSKDDNDEEWREVHSKTGNIEIMMSDEADEVTEKLLESLKKHIKIKLKE